MKQRIFAIIAAVLFLAGCTSVPVSAPEIYEKTINNTTERLQVIGALSEGVEVSLDKKDVPAAKELNDKVQSLAETPTPAQVKTVMQSLDNADASKELEAKITQLIEDKRKIEQDKLDTINTLTSELAKVRNSKKAVEEELDAMKNPFHAITYGIKTLVKRFLWTITGIGVVFLLLRTFAASNPIVGVVWTVVERIVGYLIKGISALFPAAIRYGSSLFQKRDETAKVIIDAIEQLDNGKTIADLKQKILEDSSVEHRDEIETIKRELGW